MYTKKMGNSNNYFFTSVGGTSGTILLPASSNGYSIQVASSGGGGAGGTDDIQIPKAGGGGGSGLFANISIAGSTSDVNISFKIGTGGTGGVGGFVPEPGFDGGDTTIEISANNISVSLLLPGGKGGSVDGNGGNGGTLGPIIIPTIPNGEITDLWSFGGGGATGNAGIIPGQGGIGYRVFLFQLRADPNFSGSDGHGIFNGNITGTTQRAGYGGGINGGLGGNSFIAKSYPYNNAGGGGGAGISPTNPFFGAQNYATPEKKPFMVKTDGLGRGAGYAQIFPSAVLGSVIANKNEYAGGGGGGVGRLPGIISADKSSNGGDGFIRVIKL